MKLTLRQIVNASPALGRVGAEKASAKFAYNIARNLRLTEPEVLGYQKAHNELVEKYRAKNKDGEWVIPDENQKIFTKEVEELLEQEVELDIHTFALLDEIKISGIDLFLLEWMIIVPDTEGK
jgi:hypothetical protein